MAELTRVTIGQRLEELGVSRQALGCKKLLIIIFRELVGELGTVASRVNYGQVMRKYRKEETKNDFAVENAINPVTQVSLHTSWICWCCGTSWG